MKRALLWIPFALFCFVMGIVAFGLREPEDRMVESRLVGKALPEFALPSAAPGIEGLTSKSMASGEPRLLNIFASWCGPCAIEAPHLLTLKKAGVPIDAIAIRDRPNDVAAFLQQHGNPFVRIGGDKESRVQIALGSSGVPETFVVDGKGVIRYQHLGDIKASDVPVLIAQWKAAQ